MRDALTNDALETLAHQFNDPLCFYRELIQNSLDAGSHVVDIHLTHQDGLATIVVSDTGDGMNRHIIDAELTCLFSSSKENDLTKIGKFGVGFVSVFAIEPQAVIVDTGRDGESWRVWFHENKSFTRIKLDEPMSGTEVRLVKPMSAVEFSALLARSREVVSYWCKYSDATILFQGERMNRPFDIESPVRVKIEVTGTEIVAALTADYTPFYGFYNKGLTLMEGRRRFFPQVTFLLKSRYLEHTISRDNVIEDENLKKALALVRDAVYEQLYPALLTKLEAGETHLLPYAVGLLREGEQQPKDIQGRRIFPTLSGARLDLKALQKAYKKSGAVYFARDTDDMSQALSARGVPVLKAGDDAAVEALSNCVRAVTGRPPLEAGRSFYRAQVRPPRERGDSASLEREMLRLLRVQSLPVRSVQVAGFAYAGSCIHDELAVIQKDIERPTPAPPPRPPFAEDTRLSRWHVMLNGEHPLVRLALDTARHDVPLAAHGLLKLLVLHGILDGLDEGAVAATAVADRPGMKRWYWPW
jgi:hypothetical protein